MSYAIPTKDQSLQSLPIDEIKHHVDVFIEYATDHPDVTFQLTPIGCGLAGYAHAEIAPLFDDAPANVLMPVEFDVIRTAQQR